MSRELLNCVAAAVAAALLCLGFGVPTLAAIEKYQAYLSPMPYNNAMRASVAGKGNVIATLDGDTMSLSGAFTGLASAATKAHVCLSKAAGIPGTPIFEFTVPSGVEGKVTGTFKLDETQTIALQKGQLYIQIDSEKAPDGNLWGWLLTEHEVVGPDVPQQGPWFLPQFAIKTK
jgi:CHRD domain